MLFRYGIVLCVLLALPSRTEAQVRVTVGADAAVFAGDLDLSIEGALDVQGSFNPQGAEVSFSNPDGGIALTNGLAAEIRGTNDFDALAVSGSVTLGGLLRVTLAEGASLHQGDAFVLLTCSSICSGTFDSISLPDGFDIQYDGAAVTVIASSVATSIDDAPSPLETGLLPVSPNPARENVRVVFELARPADVTINVFDVTGRRVSQLARGTHSAGRHEVNWNAEYVMSGLYVIQMIANGSRHTRTVVVPR